MWLSAWASSREKSTDYNIVDQELSTTDYITVYGIFGLFQSITFVAGILTMNRRTLAASLNVHKSIFHRVLHSTIDFIWTTPVGQVSTDSAQPNLRIRPNRNFLGYLETLLTSPTILSRLPIAFPKIWMRLTSICQTP